MAKCDIKPVSAFQSTNLSSKINSFNALGDRILHTLGYPFVNIEIHRDSLYTNIQVAIEMFTKFAGYTQEYLLFDSNLYVKNQGIKLDNLFSIDTTKNAYENDANDLETNSPDFTNKIINRPNTSYVVLSSIPAAVFTSTTLSAMAPNGLSANDIVAEGVYDAILDVETSDQQASIGYASVGLTFEIGSAGVSLLSSFFDRSNINEFTIGGTTAYKDQGFEDTSFVNSFDYDTLDYRKVIAVQDFEEGSTTGINTLFTIEQTLAQQTYFSYAMGNYGFDLISWYVLKDWLEMREKLLATKRSYSFDDRTQMLRMYPQPDASGNGTRFYGVVACQVERPIRDVIKEHWVYQYSLALSKITIANIRGKYGAVNLFGGGTLNANDLLSQGLAEKEKLELALYEGAPGLGDNEPPLFFVG